MDIANHHFGQKAIFACDVIRFDNLWCIAKHLRHSSNFAGSCVHPNVRGDTKTKNFGVNQYRVAPDSTRIFKFVNPLGDTWAGQADLCRKLADGHATVLG